MKLRSKLLALSLVTLLLPWSAWKLLQELERFLRDSQEDALLASVQTLSGSLPLEFQSRLLFAPERAARLRPLEQAPVLDGYADEWPEPQHGLEFTSATGGLAAHLLAARSDGLIHLFISVSDDTPVRSSPGIDATRGDTVRLWSRSARGLLSWVISPEAPGPVRVRGSGQDGGELEGYWLDTPDGGYTLELALPLAARGPERGPDRNLDRNLDFGLALAIEVIDVEVPGSAPARTAGTASNGRPADWISLAPEWESLSAWLASAAPPQTRAWLVDRGAWVLADSGNQEGETSQTTWLQRLAYRVVSDDRPPIEEPWSERPVRLIDPTVEAALGGSARSGWAQDLDNAVVRNTVAVPVKIKEAVRGAMVLQSRSEGLLLVTNRALGQLLLTTLGLMLALVAGLWFFASRLSRRVQRLSAAVSRAMERDVPSTDLPLIGDRDELGELARNNARLLRAVDEYTDYLQTLAGKLSHELKTPLAITRSSLDNLSSLDLDEDSRRFVDRAREGLDRQAEIVRAMSEASRLEQAIEVAEWESVDINELVSSSAAAYRAVNPGRQIETRLPPDSTNLRCAPDLLAQALDKLVDNAVTLSGPDDSVTISVESGDAEVRIGVINTGSRLPDALRERLFDSLVSMRQRRGEGPHLGLGLYIVRLVAEAHGGRVTARNLAAGEAGSGAARGVAFQIVLPHRA